MKVLITGASGGLGTAVVAEFQQAGWEVIGAARTAARNEKGIRFLEADLIQPEECRRIAAFVEPLDALVHVLGGFEGGDPVARMEASVWDRMLQLNLNAAFHMFRAALPGMLDAGHGRILAVGSRTAVEPAAGLSAYGVSKAGLVALIRTIALEVKNQGVTANVVLPSVIDTPANRKAMPKADFAKWVRPESIAKLLVWLASEEAADVNGAVIPIYGKA